MATKATDPDKGFDLEVTICENGVINCRNKVAGSGEAHSVMLDRQGNIVRCSCKGHCFHGHCYHADELSSRPLILAAARAKAAQSNAKRVATDGGEPGTTEVGGCVACDGFTTGGDKFCSPKCRKNGEPDDTPL